MNMRSVRNWWEVWDIQAVTLSSLLLQILLIFSAPLRKRVSTGMIVFPMWLAYLLADAVPVYAMGLIAKRKSSSFEDGSSNDLIVFWASFFLLHLGGPDTITAFALEDNELWHRHLLNLVVQCAVFLYAFCLSFPGNKLWLPTVLIFIVGFIKYTERTCSLYLGSFRGLENSIFGEPDRGPGYASVMDAISGKGEAEFPVRIDLITKQDSMPTTEDMNRLDMNDLLDLEVIHLAHEFHKTFKGMIVGHRFSSQERFRSQDYFLSRSAGDAFKMVELELSFFYEILYTKVLVVQGKYGFPLRIVSLSLVSVTLALFKLMDKHKEGYKKFDVVLTYILLGGAIALDAISSVMIPFSDWCSVAIAEALFAYNGGNYYKRLLRKLKVFCEILRVQRKRWSQNVHRSWSHSIPQYNLLDYCLRPRSYAVEKTIGLLGVVNILDSIKYLKKKVFNPDLRDLIFHELKMKSSMAKNLDRREIESARGDWILRMKGCTDLLPWIENVDYDESILLWHIATDLLYNIEDVETEEKSTTQGTDTNGSPFKSLSKVLSDYMMYLLIMQSTIMSSVAGIGKRRYNDTCAEAKNFFRGRNIEQDRIHISACEHIFAVKTVVKPAVVKGDRSKSVLFDACMLSKELNKLGADKWSIICRVWIEMMCYAACHCKGSTHAAQLSKGGQLITLVWLLMAHSGLGDHFQIDDRHERAKLVVG